MRTILNAAMAPEERTRTEKAFHGGTIYRVSGWRYVIMRLIGSLLRGYYATLRLRMSDADRRLLHDVLENGPVLIVSWHNRSLIAPAMITRFYDPSRICCLVSPSRAAAWEAGFYEWLGLRSVRGSSSRRAIAATRELLAQFHAGYNIALSPDGPSGPLYSWKRGIVMLARQTDAVILLSSADSAHAWRPRTWDRHFIPLPFSRVTVRIRVVEPYSSHGFSNDEEAIAFLRKKFLEVTHDPFTVESHDHT